MASPTRLLLLAMLALLGAQPAGAQGFWDSLFGTDRPAPSRPASAYARSTPAPFLFDRTFDFETYGVPPPHVRAATYRTLCVRTCDGFYFPISQAAAVGDLARDDEQCAASCSGARLFYLPNPGGDVGSMLDLTGRAYASYPFAFKHRRMLVAGCQCRPQPWTEAERARHRAYAAAEAAADRRDANTAPAAAVPDASEAPIRRAQNLPFNEQVPETGFFPQDDLRALARPTPVLRQEPTGPAGWPLDQGARADPAGRARTRYLRPGGY